MRRKIFRGLAYSLIIASILMVVLGFYADFGAFLDALRKFKFTLIAIVTFLSLLNYLTRFLRWNFYLKSVGVNITLNISAYTFFSGLLMSVTPGKSGEILKSLILKDSKGIPITLTAPVVFAERLTDLIAVVLLASAFSISFSVDYRVIVVAVIMIILLISLFFSERFMLAIERLFLRFKRLEKFVVSLHNLFKGVKSLLGIKPILVGTAFGTLAWILESVGFYLLLLSITSSTKISFAIFVYTISTLAGAVSMLPGGLVFTEATMSSILISTGYPKPASIAATVLIRALTLWFGSFLGLAVFLLNKRRFLGEGAADID
ncbi:MAG: flippase-like domain-containing protein [Actinobacteria bacterium]|nr:flippase-like domain-containing protein [Actinomycetota bacterium]